MEKLWGEDTFRRVGIGWVIVIPTCRWGVRREAKLLFLNRPQFFCTIYDQSLKVIKRELGPADRPTPTRSPGTLNLERSCGKPVPFIYGFLLPADVGEERKSHGDVLAYWVAGELATEPGANRSWNQIQAH